MARQARKEGVVMISGVFHEENCISFIYVRRQAVLPAIAGKAEK